MKLWSRASGESGELDREEAEKSRDSKGKVS